MKFIFQGFAITKKGVILECKLKIIFIMFRLFKKKKATQKPFLTEDQIKQIVAKKLENPKTQILAKKGFYVLIGIILSLFLIRQFL